MTARRILYKTWVSRAVCNNGKNAFFFEILEAKCLQNSFDSDPTDAHFLQIEPHGTGTEDNINLNNR